MVVEGKTKKRGCVFACGCGKVQFSCAVPFYGELCLCQCCQSWEKFLAKRRQSSPDVVDPFTPMALAHSETLEVLSGGEEFLGKFTPPPSTGGQFRRYFCKECNTALFQDGSGIGCAAIFLTPEKVNFGEDVPGLSYPAASGYFQNNATTVKDVEAAKKCGVSDLVLWYDRLDEKKFAMGFARSARKSGNLNNDELSAAKKAGIVVAEQLTPPNGALLKRFLPAKLCVCFGKYPGPQIENAGKVEVFTGSDFTPA